MHAQQPAVHVLQGGDSAGRLHHCWNPTWNVGETAKGKKKAKKNPVKVHTNMQMQDAEASVSLSDKSKKST